MLVLVIVAQGFDLVTFLIDALTYPNVVYYELGPIGAVYGTGGLLLSLAYKAAFLSFMLIMAYYANPYRRIILSAAFIAGAIGALANLYAFFEITGV